MTGYPKHIATVADYENLLAEPQLRDRALADLAAVKDADDETARRVISIAEDGTEEVEEIPNPMPLWKVKGFAGREAVAELISHYGGEV